MTNNYYRNEYSEKQWRALIDKALEIGCKVRYSKYGNVAMIDSTELEARLVAEHPNAIGTVRLEWAQHIHSMLHLATDLRTWTVQPKKYRKGYCATKFNCQAEAEHERYRLERQTGFEWVIIENKE